MSKQRSKEEIIDTLNNIGAFQYPETKTNVILREGIEAILEVLCDIRDNQKEQTATYIPNGMPPIERPK